MSVLNRSDKCEICGNPKDWRRQWCDPCFECLTSSERIMWTRHVSELARVAEQLHNKIINRIQEVKAPPFTTIETK